MFCPMCGNKLNNSEAKFCKHCGTQLTELLKTEDSVPTDEGKACSENIVPEIGCTKEAPYNDDVESLISSLGLEQSNGTYQTINQPKRTKKRVIIAAAISICTALGAALVTAALLLTGSISSYNNIQSYIEAGSKYLLEMNYEQAVIEFNKILKIDPKNVEAILGIAKAYHDMGEVQNAIEILQNGYQETGNERINELLNEYSGAPDNTNVPDPAYSPSSASQTSAGTTSARTSAQTTAKTTARTTTASQTTADSNEPQIAEDGIIYSDISGYFTIADYLKALGNGMIAKYADRYALPYVYSVDENMNFKLITSNKYEFNGIYGYTPPELGTFESPDGSVDKYYVVKATANGLEVIMESEYPVAVSDDGYILYFSDRNGKTITINMRSPEGNIISSKRVTADENCESPTMIYVGFGAYVSRIRNSFISSEYAYYEMDGGSGSYVFGKDGSVKTELCGSSATDLFPMETTISGVEYHRQSIMECCDKVVLEYNEVSQETNYIDAVDSLYCMYALGDPSSGKMSRFFKSLEYAGNGLFVFTDEYGKMGYMDTDGNILIKDCDDVGTDVGEYSFICMNGIYYLVSRQLEPIEIIDGTDVKAIGKDKFTCVKGSKLYLMSVS